MIIIAFFIGLIFSVPIGPLGMIMLKRSVEKGFWEGFTIAIIDAFAGFIFSLSFLIGIGQVELDPTIKLIAQLIGLLFLSWIGIKEVFFKKNKYEKIISLNKGSLLGNLLLIVFYSALVFFNIASSFFKLLSFPFSKVILAYSVKK
ncbi:MAG: hypothetical protein COZ80_05555 [Ignavibacteria bacterium CG_4_8_14_3_um_filter_37_9]|nr:MAG: hypothetical protein COW71_02260 [Ignavibacteriales bacterium CG18_big_fil_WC_8_21_14_2_50_31_20]PIS44248.1 MAG: hypothetical protein COT22_11525 [Ignavibacteria bacterium CG08_land_8_20_14_0_20_37_9]PIW99417.1 MAG: hypothetical protein COZ80_05555 [Ignavibacteria bacterium CG_4_8_14_3_um_filter_37_9]PIX94643.1 MAG: hypothetical protein COZ25_04480 [Ignavibacteria bacterium CG_4_10_14_3_um_filter_37_18]